HTFTVTATDAAGNTGTASSTWTIDTSAPTVTITSTPSNPSNQTSASFSFNSEAGATLTCQLDGGTFTTCGSPAVYAGLTAASHTFAVRATDAAGNVGSATYTWTIDTSAPTVTITGSPPNVTSAPGATVPVTPSYNSGCPTLG